MLINFTLLSARNELSREAKQAATKANGGKVVLV
jgi:hypothetical protein